MGKHPNRISEIRKQAGISREDLAERLGVSLSGLGKIERGERELTQAWLERISNALVCRPADLLPIKHGVGSMPTRRVRVLGQVQAGVFQEDPVWPAPDQFDLDASLDRSFNDLPAFGVKVVGPSMNREFPEGSIAICVRTLDLGDDFEIEPGTFVVVYRKNAAGDIEATIKQFEVDASGQGWLWPRSDHPEFQSPIRAATLTTASHDDANNEVSIWAVVIGKYSQYPIFRRGNGTPG